MASAGCTPVSGTRWESFFTTPGKECVQSSPPERTLTIASLAVTRRRGLDDCHLMCLIVQGCHSAGSVFTGCIEFAAVSLFSGHFAQALIRTRHPPARPGRFSGFIAFCKGGHQQISVCGRAVLTLESFAG